MIAYGTNPTMIPTPIPHHVDSAGVTNHHTAAGTIIAHVGRKHARR
jgi:hypothetical protein